MRPLVIGAIVLAAGLLALLWSLEREEEGGKAQPRGSSIALAPSAPAEAGSSGFIHEEDEPAPAALGGRGAGLTTLPGELDLERALWIRGRIEFPAGSPADDSLAVVAIPMDQRAPTGRESGSGEPRAPSWWKPATEGRRGWTRSPVSPDGSFRAPLPEGTRRASLWVDGRFLHLDSGLELALDPPPAELVLRPILGGCIELRCWPPARAEKGAELLAGTAARLMGAATGRGFFGFGGGASMNTRTLELPPELALEFRGLPADQRYFLEIDPGVFAGQRLLDLGVEAGGILRRELRFELGARFSGVVVDESGLPLAGARVTSRMQGQLSRMAPGATREAITDAEGAFDLRGVPARRLKLSASLDGRLPAESDEFRPVEGEHAGGLRLVLPRGGSVRGRVLYPDGSAAAGASLRLRPAGGAERAPDAEQRGRADADGAFEVAGLRAEIDYELLASAREPGAGPAEQNAERDESWRARAAPVRPGSGALELVLAAPVALRGRVFDPAGQPLERYVVRANLEESELGRGSRVRREISDPEGRFALAETFAGTWSIAIEADGLVTAEEEIRVQVPQPESELRIDLLAGARVEGQVLRPDGEVAAQADVRISKGGSRNARPGMPAGFDPGARSVRTGDDGRFAFKALRAGSWSLVASDGLHAPSSSLPLDLQPGSALVDLSLHLGAGGMLTGEVYDARGAPDAGRTIMAMSMTAGDGKTALADAAGRFSIPHLAPGQYMVVAQPDLSRLSEIEQRGDEVDPMDFMSSMKTASATITEGSTTHVVLGAPPKAPVRIFGRVTEAGEPVGEGSVMVISEGRSLLEAWKPGRVDASGRYEVVIDEPGDVLVSYQSRAFRGSGIEYYVRVPAASEHRFDIELPSGSIEGVVLGPDGQPLPGERVSIERESGLRSLGTMDGQAGERTDEAGRFRFTRLLPARYTLRAGGERVGLERLGASVVAGIEVGESTRIRDLRIQLPRSGKLRGRVLDAAGRPAAGVTIFVRDRTGRTLEPFSSTLTDAEGRFERDGIAPGEVSVSARGDGLASPEVGPLRIREGAETEVELRLGEGTMLRVVVEDPEGRTIRAELSVLDEAGREHASLRSFASMQTFFAEGFSTTEQRVGPLPPGNYEVVVTTSEGHVERRPVKLSGRAERKLRLRVGE